MLSTLNLASTRGVARDFAKSNRQGRNGYKYPRAQAGALAMPSISEDAPAHHGHDKLKALTSGSSLEAVGGSFLEAWALTTVQLLGRAFRAHLRQ